MVNEEFIQGGVRFSTDQGSIEMTFPNRHMVVIRYHGVGETELATPALERLTKTAYSSRALCVMNDAEALTNYESGFRQKWTEWLRLHRQYLKAFHLLHCSSVIRVGVNLANVIVGDVIKSYPDRATFDAAVDELRKRSA
jgi:hypothetical protein